MEVATGVELPLPVWNNFTRLEKHYGVYITSDLGPLNVSLDEPPPN
jgi:hypothetical protein